MVCCVILIFVNRANGGVLNSGPVAITEYNKESARRARREAQDELREARKNMGGAGGTPDSVYMRSPFTLKTPEMLRRQLVRKIEVMRKSMGRG